MNNATDQQHTADFDVDNPWTIASVVIGSGIALLALLTGPLLVSEYIVELGVSESRAGMIMSMEMAGFTLGSAILFGVLGKDWQKITTVSLIFMVIGNGLFLLVTNQGAFIIFRFIAGIGEGLLMAMTIQVIALMRNPDRIYGLWTAGQLVFGILGLLLFPTVIALGGLKAVFMIWALLALILFITVKYYPLARTANNVEINSITSGRKFILGILGLIGLFIYYSGQTGVWVYMDRLGLSWNLDQETVLNTLFVGLIAGIAGSGVAALLGNKLGRALPLTISMTFSALSIVLLIMFSGANMFVFAVCLFNFGWYLFLPYVSAVIAATDDNGKLLTGLAVTFPASLAIGPAVAAMLISNVDSFIPVLIFGLVSVPLGLVCILPASFLKSA
jgi:MFS transporter, DHA1 family, inner membrane transport protein